MVESAQLFEVSPVIPVVTIEDPADAVPLAQALLDGGIRIIELTLRTDSALESLRRISTEVPDILIGAGTILSPSQADAAIAAGAQFLVSPGTTPALLDHLLAQSVPVLPGVATVSEILTVLERGITTLKFFPAAQAGGQAYLKSVGAPIPQARFCPTGGITLATAPDFLALPNVACIGGSWLTPMDAVQEKNWQYITDLSREAMTLGR
ncbi:keto-deoxy-phosphogluconate aldolase [Arthrobacter sp. RIT-PI-e]|uniref:bifunctional 4-hydroxy-2-oxoglutarate aldolase/2-dehydro-3-deoxy-phosphogluconate aldolase n=1 Tax=Arthrobacter sp. RIT-PI-e TaxID=1681197 RepID=UPI0006766449|nr:bifunctional 4-hydroxy-2-oxoglutarate aldolase/2-dehydro-3-deoxy-phosphogluconate aldolase [Arthrobacter sp. RIT-PI-e]KNC20134.1 keto-deoxy-phosphogluconate aldolase [Arthrobacter sp. RIT-PI-e]